MPRRAGKSTSGWAAAAGSSPPGSPPPGRQAGAVGRRSPTSQQATASFAISFAIWWAVYGGESGAITISPLAFHISRWPQVPRGLPPLNSTSLGPIEGTPFRGRGGGVTIPFGGFHPDEEREFTIRQRLNRALVPGAEPWEDAMLSYMTYIPFRPPAGEYYVWDLDGTAGIPPPDFIPPHGDFVTRRAADEWWRHLTDMYHLVSIAVLAAGAVIFANQALQAPGFPAGLYVTRLITRFGPTRQSVFIPPPAVERLRRPATNAVVIDLTTPSTTPPASPPASPPPSPPALPPPSPPPAPSHPAPAPLPSPPALPSPPVLPPSPLIQASAAPASAPPPIDNDASGNDSDCYIVEVPKPSPEIIDISESDSSISIQLELQSPSPQPSYSDSPLPFPFYPPSPSPQPLLLPPPASPLLLLPASPPAASSAASGAVRRSGRERKKSTRARESEEW